MISAGEVVATIRNMGDGAGPVLMEVAEFFSGLPDDLDLASASYYLNKEFKRNDTGVDNRVEIYTGEPESYDDSGESWYDSSGYDQDDYDDDYWDDL